MQIEVELKARLRDPSAVRARLRSLGSGVDCTYRDTYYDWPDHRLDRAGRQELRLRVIENDRGGRCVLTLKGEPRNAVSTVELETEVSRADMADAILLALGLRRVIAYTKECQNFTLIRYGHGVLASVVHLPELGDTFIEVETLVFDAADVPAARDAVLQVLSDLDLEAGDLEPTFYVDLVAQARLN